jgi:hypothetical protein
MMMRIALAVALLALPAAVARATGVVTVAGTPYPTAHTSTIGGKAVPMALTGAAVRTKYLFNIYTVGSYVQHGSAVRTPEALAALDGPKELVLVLKRAVSGADMASATEAAIRANYPAPRFADEVAALCAALARHGLAADDRVWLTHVPGVGLSVRVDGRDEAVIRNPQFSRAVWDIYLGQHNLGEDIKRALVSR